MNTYTATGKEKHGNPAALRNAHGGRVFLAETPEEAVRLAIENYQKQWGITPTEVAAHPCCTYVIANGWSRSFKLRLPSGEVRVVGVCERGADPFMQVVKTPDQRGFELVASLARVESKTGVRHEKHTEFEQVSRESIPADSEVSYRVSDGHGGSEDYWFPVSKE